MTTETNANTQYLDMEGLQFYDSLVKAKLSADISASESKTVSAAALDASAKASQALENARTYTDGQTEAILSTAFTPITEAEINALFVS